MTLSLVLGCLFHSIPEGPSEIVIRSLELGSMTDRHSGTLGPSSSGLGDRESLGWSGRGRVEASSPAKDPWGDGQEEPAQAWPPYRRLHPQPGLQRRGRLLSGEVD